MSGVTGALGKASGFVKRNSESINQLGTGFNTLGTTFAESSSLRFESEAAKNRQLASQFNVLQAQQVGQVNIDSIRLQASLREASGRVGFAASNILLGEGTPLDFELDSASQEAYDVVVERYNTANRVTFFRNKAAQEKFNKARFRRASRTQLLVGSLNAFSSIAPAVSNLAGGK